MILCGVDDSDGAAQAARFAADVAVRVGAGLILLHVAPTPYVSPRFADYHELMEEQKAFHRAGYLGTVLEPIRVNPAATVVRLVEFGLPVEVLRARADDLDVTHLVVGSRGQGAVAEVLVASTSGPLAREAPCPVILVPPEVTGWSDDSADRPIVCGVDGSDGSRAAARRAAELAQHVGARLVLATVVENAGEDAPEAVLDDVRAVAGGVGIDAETLSGQPADELLALARRIEALLTVVGSRGRGAVKAALLGSVSGRLVQESDRPVMVVSSRSTTSS
jgi:nucleotide-binding universal stress UspA family protein